MSHLGPVWFEGREGKGREGREEEGGERLNITLFGLMRMREGNGREGEGSMTFVWLRREGEGDYD